MKVITAIGDSIVDTVGRSSVGDTDQWLYKLMQALGETDIKLEPLPEFGVTPNILQGRWTDHPLLCDGSIEEYGELSEGEYIINFSPYYSNDLLVFAVRAFSEGPAFSLQCYTSMNGVTWSSTPSGTITKQDAHSPGWTFANWTPKDTRYVKIVITGTARISELQIVANIGNDRGSCLNKMVGTNYTFNNVGLGSQQTEACLQRFRRDVIDLGSDTVIILAGINDIYQNTKLSLTQERLLAMYDLADEAGINVIPCTLLPYTPSSLSETRFEEIKAKIQALNTWIRSTAAIRRYGLCDWYNAMEDPNKPGYMVAAYTGDGIHLSILGNTKIVEAFDLKQLSWTTHDLYATPVYKIPFTAQRKSSFVNFIFGNGVEKEYQIYANTTPGVNNSSTIVYNFSGGQGDVEIEYATSAYFRAYGINTNVWSEEIFIKGVPTPPPPPTATPTRTRKNIGVRGTGINMSPGIRARH